MERLFRLIVCTAFAIVFFQSKAYARDIDEKQMYLGASYEYSFYNVNDKYQNYFNKDFPGADVFLGWRPHEMFGAEFGYSVTTSKNKSVNVANGSTVPGTTVGVNADTNINTKLKMKNTHLDINAYYPTDQFDLMGSLGIGFLRQKIMTKVTGDEGNVGQVFALKGKTKAVPRFGVGVDRKLNTDWGVRGMVRYQPLSGAKIRDNGKVLGNDPFSRSVVVSLSVYHCFASA